MRLFPRPAVLLRLVLVCGGLLIADADGSCAFSQVRNVTPPLTVTPPANQLSKPIGNQITINPSMTCPKGYIVSQNAIQNLHLMICEVDPTGMNLCAAQPNSYRCGADGTECCQIGAENPCFPGAYACSVSSSAGVQPHTACCVSR